MIRPVIKAWEEICSDGSTKQKQTQQASASFWADNLAIVKECLLTHVHNNHLHFVGWKMAQAPQKSTTKTVSRRSAPESIV